MLTTDKLIPIVDTAKAGYSLPQALYCQEDAFSQDMARVIKQNGYSSTTSAAFLSKGNIYCTKSVRNPSS